MAPTMLTGPVRAPAAWGGADLAHARSPIHHLTAAEIAGIDAAIAVARAGGAAGKRALICEAPPCRRFTDRYGAGARGGSRPQVPA